MYPAAKTGDWGMARKIGSDDDYNPLLLRGAGTEGYLASVSAIQLRF